MLAKSNPRIGGFVNLQCRKRFPGRICKYWSLYLFLLPGSIYTLLFHYLPMYGVLIAFKNFKPVRGILGSEWVGLYNFQRFFKMEMFESLIRNTLGLSVYSLAAGFAFPILFAVLLNTCRSGKFQKVLQTVTYIPHFLSIVIMVGIINLFFSPSMGLFSNLMNNLGIIDGPLLVLLNADAFNDLYVWSGIWQGLGWGSIIYLAALTGVDQELYEAAILDGANKFQRVMYIDIPWIMPTMVIMLILNCGGLMNVGFEKIFLMQNSMNLDASEVISTYVYKLGILNAQYSFSAAVGMFNSIINMILLLTVNWVARKLGNTGLM